MDQTVANGHFARKQLFSPSRLISWSHRRRFEMGLQLIGDVAGKQILDFGCGDATFLVLLTDQGRAPAEAVGAEIDPRTIDDNNQRLRDRPGLRFVLQKELDLATYDQRFDWVICMEVCEHLVKLDGVLDLFRRVLRPGGRLMVSVPVETGLPLLVKQASRRIAGWRGIGDYRFNARYSICELWKSVGAGDSQHMERPVYKHLDGTPFHDHKGFNWRVLREKIRAGFRLDAVHASPVSSFPPQWNSQAWMLATRL